MSHMVAHLSLRRANVIRPSSLIPGTRCLNSLESIMQVLSSVRRGMLTLKTDDYRSNVGSLLSVPGLAYRASECTRMNDIIFRQARFGLSVD